jgi:hypothetical protein
MSPFSTMAGTMRLTSNLGGISLAYNNPITLSASRMEETSGVQTTTASSAAATAFSKPCSMPAGQSMRMKSNFLRNSLEMRIMSLGVNASLLSFCEAGIK